MTYIIGDLHGCFFTLKKLISKLPEGATVLFVGDLCDKGNYTKEIIEFILENDYKSIKGNHEIFMELYLKDAIVNNKKNVWNTSKTFGGSKTVNSYKNSSIELIDHHISFIANLPLYIIIDNYFITHGFGLPYFERRDTHPKALVSNRIERPYPDWDDFSQVEYINIFGHSAFDEVLRDPSEKLFGIDTGAVYGNKLTAFELGTHQVIEVLTDPRDIS